MRGKNDTASPQNFNGRKQYLEKWSNLHLGQVHNSMSSLKPNEELVPLFTVSNWIWITLLTFLTLLKKSTQTNYLKYKKTIITIIGLRVYDFFWLLWVKVRNSVWKKNSNIIVQIHFRFPKRSNLEDQKWSLYQVTFGTRSCKSASKRKDWTTSTSALSQL